MKVPFLDLKAQFREIEADVRARWEAVLANTSFILGPQVEEFEQAFAAFLGCRHVVGVGSGLAALELSLRALEIGPGDAVLVPANTFIATALAVSAVGAVPVLIDMDPATYNMDTACIRRFLDEQCVAADGRLRVSDSCRFAFIRGSRIRAIMPVHLYGRPADMDAIMALADRHHLRVIEDACQAHGARYKGRRVGTVGVAGAFSFYPGKNLGAYGDGGAVATNDDALARTIRKLRNYGCVKKYQHELAGTNSRLDSLQAAVLNAKLPHLDAWNAAGRARAARYAEGLRGCREVVCPAIPPDSEHVYHLYVIRAQSRDDLQKHLAKHGIETGLHYPVSMHLSGAYNHLGHSAGDFPETERAAAEILSLPIYPELTETQVDYVCESVRAFYRG